MISIDQRYNSKTEWSALHKAISEENVDITHELIKRGADINARSCIGTTPLFHAIDTGNLEIFCMLLCYNTDVTIRNVTGITALTYAIQNENTEMAQLLSPYYDNFNFIDIYNNALYLDVQCDRILAFELLELGADVNGINDLGYCVLGYILMTNDVELFKKVWPKFNYQILLRRKLPLFIAYLRDMRKIPLSEWLECFYLILECPIARDLIQHYIDFYNSLYENRGFSHFLKEVYQKRHVSLNHIANIITIYLSLGVNVKIEDLNTIFDLFGYKEDFEMLLYAADNFTDYNFKFYPLHCSMPLLTVILGMEDFNIKTVTQIMESRNSYFKSLGSYIERKEIFDCLGFFSMSYSTKQNLSWFTSCHEMLEKINRIPEFPTLLELSRNQAHTFIRQTYTIRKAYHFLDAVKRLYLPQHIKDIIRFKIPIYQ